MENHNNLMKVVVLEEVGRVAVREVPIPEPLGGEILIRIEYCLLCTWEQRLFSGASKMTFPFIAGHEVAGVVAAIPSSTTTGFLVGDPVTVKTLDSCGHCEACYRGDDNLCTGKAKKRFYDGIPSSGGLAQYISLPVSRVYALPDKSIDRRLAAFAEPLACCIHSVEMANITFGEDVVIVGAGIMGQLHVALAQKRGARVMVVEPDAERARLALKMGAAHVINPLECDAQSEIRRLTNGNGAHVVFITTTQTVLAQEYILALTKKGRIIYYGSFHPDGDIAVNPNMVHYSERVITGSYSPTSRCFWIASRMIGYDIIDMRPFLSAEFSLKDVQEAFVQSQDKKNFRVLIDFRS